MAKGVAVLVHYRRQERRKTGESYIAAEEHALSIRSAQRTGRFRDELLPQ